MTTPAKRERSSLADVFDWFQQGFPPMSGWPMAVGAQSLRVEDYVTDDRYVLRAELPGVDPEKDVEITVDDGVLTVRAERREERKEVNRSEFRYGSLTRSVTLPAGAREDDVTASYADGILEVSVGLGAEKPQPRRVPIARREQ
jgi:HSP20 family protein